jgi:integrase
MIIRLPLWTGARRGEVGGMRWSELAADVWAIPGARTKNHRVLELPLPRQALAAIEAWPQFVGRDHLFERRSAHGFNGWHEAKRRLDTRLRFNQDWDLHDCRRTVETRMAGLGIPKDHANRVLNHAIGPVTEAYDRHDYMPEKATALARWADELDRIVGCGNLWTT